MDDATRRTLQRMAARWVETPNPEIERDGALRPSHYGLGPFVKIERPDGYQRTDTCTAEQLRAAERLAFEDQTPERAGLIAYYRHARFGADHPDGYVGELFGDPHEEATR
jgi:hypothetical protein